MIKRELYIDQLRNFIDKPVIKALTGVRRSGKSSILMLLRNELLSRGIPDPKIIYINFESLTYSEITDAMSFYKYIKSKIADDERYYLLFDEIQEVADWEKAINSFLVDFNVDIYITGSNSRLLSSELSTLIAGRYVEINVKTLSFSEYLVFQKYRDGIENSEINYFRQLYDFIRLGGFPAIHVAGYNFDDACRIISDIYASALLRDTIQRFRIRNIELLERIVKFIFDNIGNCFSANKVADYFKSQHRRVDLNTVYNYLSALESSFIIKRVQRFDVKGKEILKTNEKFYIADHSIKYSLLGYKDRDISGIIENIVFHELERRGYRVYIGKLDDKEIDFVAEKKEERIYVQVAYKLSADTTISREFAPLLSINDHFPKYVVTMEEFWKDNVDGVIHKNLADFLLMPSYSY